MNHSVEFASSDDASVFCPHTGEHRTVVEICQEEGVQEKNIAIVHLGYGKGLLPTAYTTRELMHEEDVADKYSAENHMMSTDQCFMLCPMASFGYGTEGHRINTPFSYPDPEAAFT